MGLSFVWACFEKYWDGCLYPLLFAGCLIWILWKCKKGGERVFLYSTLFLLLTVWNPLFAKYVVPVLNLENEYYRFFWLLPVPLVLAWMGVSLVWKAKKRWQKGIVAAAVAAVVMLTGIPLRGVVYDFAMAENLYKIPNDLRAVCDVIHQDWEEKGHDSSTEMVWVVFEEKMNSQVRQYDASIHPVLYRDAVLYRAGSSVTAKMDENNPWYQRQKAIMDVVYYEEPVDQEVFVDALVKSAVHYLVVRTDRGIHDYLREAGCTPIAQTENYIVYTRI